LCFYFQPFLKPLVFKKVKVFYLISQKAKMDNERKSNLHFLSEYKNQRQLKRFGINKNLLYLSHQVPRVI